MEIFVTGGTGYIGRHVVRHLLRGGHRVVALARSEASAATLRSMGATPVLGDLSDTQLIQDTLADLKSAGGVVHAGFSHDDWTGIADAFARDRDVVTAMLEVLEGTHRAFVYTSGSGVWGDTGHMAAAEEAAEVGAPHPVSLRIETEKLVVQAGVARGVRTAVVRPGLVYGRGGGGMMQLLLGLARQADGPVTVGNGRNVWSAVHIDDLAELYSLVLDKAAAGEVYHAANGEGFSFHDIAVAAAKGSDNALRPLSSMPLQAARQKLGLLADGLVANKRISSRKAIETLHWRPVGASIVSEIELGSYAVETSGKITMINGFEVPPEATEQYLRDWNTDLAFMTRQNGSMGGILYKATQDSAARRFVNVAHWDSMASFQTAASNMSRRFQTDETSQRGDWGKLGIRMDPATYTAYVKF